MNNTLNEKENAMIWKKYFGNNIFGTCQFCELKCNIKIDKESKKILNITEKTLRYKYIPSVKYLKLNNNSDEILPVCFYCYEKWRELNKNIIHPISLENISVSMDCEDNNKFLNYVNDYLKFSKLCNYYDIEKSTYCCNFTDDEYCDKCIKHYNTNTNKL